MNSLFTSYPFGGPEAMILGPEKAELIAQDYSKFGLDPLPTVSDYNEQVNKEFQVELKVSLQVYFPTDVGGIISSFLESPLKIPGHTDAFRGVHRICCCFENTADNCCPGNIPRPPKLPEEFMFNTPFLPTSDCLQLCFSNGILSILIHGHDFSVIQQRNSWILKGPSYYGAIAGDLDDIIRLLREVHIPGDDHIGFNDDQVGLPYPTLENVRRLMNFITFRTKERNDLRRQINDIILSMANKRRKLN
jgi:hypothetical protein